MLGKILIYLVTLSGLGSAILYFLSYKKNDLQKYASILYYIMVALVVASGIYLLENIFIHNFQFTYIWEYSSKELHDYFLYASFYSGQQGSFMLWMIILSIIGLFLQRSSRKHNNESLSMGFYVTVILFLAVILIFKSPFDYVWESFAKDGVAVGFTPENGRGLNPILQNYWITIHPPILFIGYSLMTIPFVFALTSLIMKDFRKWIDYVMPWILIGGGVLGFGIMLGGFWAYETLGWGGYWGWDPVENSSFIPWIFIVAFLHTVIVQRKTGGLIKTNYILGMLSFIFVLYATFLTRSGILGESSVHSFAEPSAIVYYMLVAFLVVYFLIGVALVIWRIKDINKFILKSVFSPISREYTLTLGSILLVAMGIIVIMGTSWPAVAELFGKEKVAIDVSNYNKFGIVFAIVFLVLNALSLYQKWKSTQNKDLLKRIIIPISISIVATIIFYLCGVDQFSYLLLTFAAIFSISVNSEFLIRNVIHQPKKIGAYLAHLGIALFILGSLASGGFSTTKQVRLTNNQTKEAFGYDFTFIGKHRIEQDLTDREKYYYTVEIKKGNSVSYVKPIIYWSNFNNFAAPFLEPSISARIEKDIYVSPKSIEQDLNLPGLTLSKSQSDMIPVDKSLKITLESFTMNEMGMGNQDKVAIGTILIIEKNGMISKDTITSMLDVNSWESGVVWTKLKNYAIDVSMVRLIRDMNNVANTQALLYFKKTNENMPEASEIFTFDVTIKPYINLVWIGTFMTVIGFAVALGKNSKKNLKIQQDPNITQ
jgi:cytochrome c-type biogenesis protein CcmF